MDNITKALYRQAIKLYEAYLAGERTNVIDPDGSTPSRKIIKVRILRLKQSIL